MKSLIIGAGLALALVLTSCSDRVRENCIRNKAPSSVGASPVKCK